MEGERKKIRQIGTFEGKETNIKGCIIGIELN